MESGSVAPRIPMVCVVPLVGAAIALARQLRSDAPGSEHLGKIVADLSGLRDGAPLVRIPIDRPNVLRVTVPAAFADVDPAPLRLELVSLRRRHGLAEDRLQRRGPGDVLFQQRQDSLTRHRERVEAHRGNQDDRLDPLHRALPIDPSAHVHCGSGAAAAEAGASMRRPWTTVM